VEFYERKKVLGSSLIIARKGYVFGRANTFMVETKKMLIQRREIRMLECLVLGETVGVGGNEEGAVK